MKYRASERKHKLNHKKDSFFPYKEIRAFQRVEGGAWHLKHRGPTGKFVEYSTKVKCSRLEIEDYIKKSKLPELIKAGEATHLTKEIVDRILVGKSYCMADAIEEWQVSLLTSSPSTRTKYLFLVNRFIKKYGFYAKSPRDVTEHYVYEWLNRKADLKLSTRKIEKAAISSLFTYLRNKGLCNHNPAASKRIIDLSRLEHKQREVKHAGVISEPELKQILDYLSAQLSRYKDGDWIKMRFSEIEIEKRVMWLKFWWAACLISYATAMRMSDVVALEWDCFDKDWLTVWTLKREQRIRLPLSKEAIAELEDKYGLSDKARKCMMETAALVLMAKKQMPKYFAYNPKNKCFPHQHELTRTGYSNRMAIYFRRVLNRSEVCRKGISFHSFRTSRITKWNNYGVGMDLIGKLVAHKDETTTKNFYLDNIETILGDESIKLTSK